MWVVYHASRFTDPKDIAEMLGNRIETVEPPIAPPLLTSNAKIYLFQGQISLLYFDILLALLITCVSVGLVLYCWYISTAPKTTNRTETKQHPEYAQPIEESQFGQSGNARKMPTPWQELTSENERASDEDPSALSSRYATTTGKRVQGSYQASSVLSGSTSLSTREEDEARRQRLSSGSFDSSKNTLVDPNVVANILLTTGNSTLRNWMLVRKKNVKHINSKKKTKKPTHHIFKWRFVEFDRFGRLSIYTNEQGALNGTPPKGSMIVTEVKTAAQFKSYDGIEDAPPNVLGIHGSLGGLYYLKIEEKEILYKWLVILKQRSSPKYPKGMNHMTISLSPKSQNLSNMDRLTNFFPKFGGETNSSIPRNIGLAETPTNKNVVEMQQTHSLKATVVEFSFDRSMSYRQFYTLLKLKSELHNHSDLPVGQTRLQPADRSQVIWSESFTWEFQNHPCKDCEECNESGLDKNYFSGLPDVIVLHLYGVSISIGTFIVNPDKLGTYVIPLKNFFGQEGMQESSMLCSWPMYDTSEKKIGNLKVRLAYEVNSGVDVIIPFLVSNANEREVVSEQEIHPSIKNCKQFYKTVYETDKSPIWEAYYKEREDSEINSSDWEESSEYGGKVRTLSFRSLTNANIGPATTMTTSVQHLSYPSEEDIPEDRFELSQKFTFHDIPFGDCFTVEQVVEVVKNESGQLVAKLHVAVPFSKGTMFKSKIIDATKIGVASSFALLCKCINDHCTSETNASQPSQQESSMTEQRPSRPRLARVHSTMDGGIALEEIFENQRISLFGNWGPNHLLPTDRPRFSNRDGDIEMSFDKVKLRPNWIWTSAWKVDYSYTDTDDEGWSYATDFPRFNQHLERGKSNTKKIGNSVRRRRWIRTLCYVPESERS